MCIQHSTCHPQIVCVHHCAFKQSLLTLSCVLNQTACLSLSFLQLVHLVI